MHTVKINCAFLHHSMQTARLRKNKGLEILSGEHVATQKSQGDSPSLLCLAKLISAGNVNRELACYVAG